MSKKNSIVSVDSYEELGEEIWNAIVDYTHEVYGDSGHIQSAFNGEEEVFLIRPVQAFAQED